MIASKMEYIESILICNSNMFIPTVLTEVLSNTDKNYLVISDTDNIRQFFVFLDIPNVIYHHYGFQHKVDGHFGFIKRRKELFKYVCQFEIGNVVFFHAEFGAMANWLIKKLSSCSIPIKYCKIYNSIPVPKCTDWKRIIRIKLKEYLYWGVKMDVLQNSYAFPSLPQSFFKDVKAEIISMPINRELISKVVKSRMMKMNLCGQCVLLTGTAVRDNIYAQGIYEAFINQLIDSIGKDKVVSKCHPRYKDLYGLEKDLTQIPSFIPGNVLLDSFDYYIGVESTLLVEAAHAGKTAISIIDCLCPTKILRQRFHIFFESRLGGKGTIYYPKTLAELKIIIKTK